VAEDHVGLRAVARYQLNRLRNAWWGNDLSNLRRLEKQGRVVRGVGTYGVPTVWTFPHEEQTRLIIGKYSAVGGTHLLGGQHAVRHVASYPLRIHMGMEGAGEDGNPAIRGDIVIGSDVWVTFGSYVLSGVTIGDGAVVASGAVISKDVPPYAIVGGNPAKLIKYRHTEEQIAALLEIKWWDWPEDEIRKAVPYLASEDVDAFIAYARANEPMPEPEPSLS
jgi:chloramphenicol O-acetyltransferase type B